MPEPLISIARARDHVRGAASRLPAHAVRLDLAADRVLAQDVVASEPVPGFASSAMDGYAIMAGTADRSLRLVGESRAGTPWAGRLSSGQAVRISTGAAVPDGATAVVRQEDVSPSDGSIEIHAAVAAGQNIREAGESLRQGAPVLAAGTRLGPAELAAAVAAGAGEVEVVRRPRVHVLCTGDELRDPGERLAPGQIHNSNGPMLVALARRCGAEVARHERLTDDRQETETVLRRALADSDLVIVSGGVSVGPHDHVKPALAALGVGERFWGVALQPGKPTWFGTCEQTLVFGLPGNPVSAAVTFSLFAAPALAALQGADPPRARPPAAALAVDVRQNPAREQALRVRLEWEAEGAVAHPNGAQGSHMIGSLVGADALALIPPGAGRLEAGARVALEPLVR